MDIIATTKVNGLRVVDTPFQVVLAWKLKRDETDWWFTPSGVLKIYNGALYRNKIGNLEEYSENEMVSIMKQTQRDILTDGKKFYTRMDGFVELPNVKDMLDNALIEYEARRDIESWTDEIVEVGTSRVFDDVVFDERERGDEVLEEDERGRWTQLCTNHMRELELDVNGKGLISDGGSGTCGVKGCSEESHYYYDF